MKKNWKTTAFGIVSAIGGLCTAALPYLDDDPATTLDLKAIVAAVVALAVGVGLISASDAEKKKPEE